MITDYLQSLQLELLTGNAMEHSYRPALKKLIEQIEPKIIAVNEPTRSAHGNPDFIYLERGNKNFIKGYTETKDVNTNLDDIEKTDQLKRYLGYSRLILTNYLEFRFYRNGEKYQTVEIAKIDNKVLRPIEFNFSFLEREILAFLEGKPEAITSAVRLAKIMGGKANRIYENVNRYLTDGLGDNEELGRIYSVMRKLLVHDLSIQKFADMYAQTLVYGLFVARYYDKTPENFSRAEARDLIPASNPFLQQFFDHIAGAKFDTRLGYIVDELCEIFSVANIQFIIQKHFNLLGEQVDKDPIIHFYEDFLKEYDPELRRSMGAYYTPVPVVLFIIRAINDVLIKEFGLINGIADTEKIEKDWFVQGIKAKTKKILHRVQILDPAVGTATFLNEMIKFIHAGFTSQEGLWKSYVDNELLPRMHGFELMMAPYTIAHLKLAMTLRETGIDHFDHRLGIYLTNTLEEGVVSDRDLFTVGLAEAITEEGHAASKIKHDTPIMVIMANPPYSGVSSNETNYANELVSRYKVEPGGKEKLNERKHWLNDDYVKFIAFAERMIEKNDEGIIGMITNHGYLDNPTFRGMRWHLLKTFSKIYILDLHGNAKKKVKVPNGGKDENIFEIQQGVAIIIAIKKKGYKNKMAKVFRSDLWGTKKSKFDMLAMSNISDIKWEELDLDSHYLTFASQRNKNTSLQMEYDKAVSIKDIFTINTTGIVTARDGLVIAQSKGELIRRIYDFFDSSKTNEWIRHNFFPNKKQGKYLAGDSRGWKLVEARESLAEENHEFHIVPIAYRPFDIRWIYYHPRMVDWGREKIMNQFIVGENIGLMVCRQQKSEGFHHVLVNNQIVESSYLSNKTSEIGYSFPLYIYEELIQSELITTPHRRSNLNLSNVKVLLGNLGKYIWVDDDKDKILGDESKISSLDVLDYIYAVLHSPLYRNKFEPYLRTDFPKVPIAKNIENFWSLVKLGEQLRHLHLLENLPTIGNRVSYPIPGDNIIKTIKYEKDRVWINEIQFFGGITQNAWELIIGSYQPALKWLKDRQGRELNYEDILHYQQIIVSLTDTSRIMGEIDKILQLSINVGK